MKRKGLAVLLSLTMALSVFIAGCTGISEKPESTGSAFSSQAEESEESAEEESTSSSVEESTTDEASEASSEETTAVAEGRALGVYAEDPGFIKKFDTAPQIIAWFENLDGSNASDKKLAACLDDSDVIPMITLQPNTFYNEDVANGAADEYLMQFFARVTQGDRVNKTVIVRYAHEMEMTADQENNWYSWQTRDTETYIAAWRHVVDLGRQAAPNVKWLWSPTKAVGDEVGYYPGDDWVDYVGVTVNEFEEEGMYDTFEEFYTVCGKEEIESYGKPILLPECSYGGTDEEAKRAYLQSMYEYLENPDNNIYGIVVFNSDKTDERQFKFTDNEDQFNDFKEAVKVLAGE